MLALNRVLSRRAWKVVQLEVEVSSVPAQVGTLRLAVVLAGGGAAEVAGRGVDDAVGHVDGGEHLLLEAEQALVLGCGVLGAAVDEHLDLVELVHPDDAAGVP